MMIAVLLCPTVPADSQEVPEAQRVEALLGVDVYNDGVIGVSLVYSCALRAEDSHHLVQAIISL